MPRYFVSAPSVTLSCIGNIMVPSSVSTPLLLCWVVVMIQRKVISPLEKKIESDWS